MKLKKTIFVAATILFLVFMFLVVRNSVGHRPYLEEIANITPSFLLVLYRYEFFNKFLLLSILFIISILIILSISVWLLNAISRRTKKIQKIQLISLISFLIFFICGAYSSYSWLISRIYFANGYMNYQEKQDTQAITLYNKAIEISPDFIDPYIELIQIHHNREQFEKVITIGEKFPDFEENKTILELLGKTASEMGDFQQAISYYNDAKKNSISEETDLELANLYLSLENYEYSDQICLIYPSHSQFALLLAKSLYRQNKYTNALNVISNAINMNPSNPESWYVQGKIYSALGSDIKAINSYKQAVWLKKEYPEAYREIALIYLISDQLNHAIDYLQMVCYYDNLFDDAFIRLKLLEEKKTAILPVIKRNNEINFNFSSTDLVLDKNQTTLLEVILNCDIPQKRLRFNSVDPYGWGIKSKMTKLEAIEKNKYKAYFNITGLRDSKVNLDKPWKLNFIIYDVETGQFNNKTLGVHVQDNSKGKIFYLISEDLECSEGPHKDDATPHRSDLSTDEIEIDLYKKGMLADSIANIYNIKWSHLVDLGSAWLRIKWLKDVSANAEWAQTFSRIKNLYSSSIIAGNDIQLHIHTYNIPGSPNFSQIYDKTTNQLVFNVHKHNITTPYIDGHFGSWANILNRLGSFRDKQSRIGSIFHGISVLEDYLVNFQPDYRTIVFRAGEWEFGESKDEMMKSIIALRKNKILAGSDAYMGNFGKRDFRFNKRVDENVYFSRLDNIRKSAKSLLDVGILQIVPVPELHHYSHSRPIDDSFSVRRAYDLCFDDSGYIKKGVHLLLEMYHINRINYADENWDSMDMEYGDWKKIRTHFKEISEHLKKAQFVTFSEAVLEYMDYYSPDVLALRINEQLLSDNIYTYDIRFLGREIKIDKDNAHFASVKPPAYLLDSIREIKLIYDTKTIKTWNNISDYEDLEFKTIDRNGYKLQVFTTK
jgi:tetratricopeptide (TPR) repeat protein